MKSKNYTRLKINILLQTMLVVLFTALVGYLFKNLVIDGIYNHKFADGFVHFFYVVSYAGATGDRSLLESDWKQ